MTESTAADFTDAEMVDRDLLAHFTELRDEAVEFAMLAADAEAYARYGETGRSACAEDIGFHLDFLRSALETNEIALFTGYLAWLVQVLGQRGVPHQSVMRCLDDLATFFANRLGARSSPIVAALAAGKQSLVEGIVAPSFDRPCPIAWDDVEPFLAAALRGKQAEATDLLDSAFARKDSLPLVAMHVIQPAMYDVGRLWQQNGVSVAQEHFATALSQSWMARTMARARPAPDNGRRALFGCLAANHHALGLRMVADAFELDGWATNHMGLHATPETAIRQIRELRPHLVGFSASLPRHLSGLRQLILRLRTVLGDECPRIVVGGLVINQFPRLAGWVGAEALGSNAISAAAAAREVP